MLSLIFDLLFQKQPINHHYFTALPTGTHTARREVWSNESGRGFCSYAMTARVKRLPPSARIPSILKELAKPLGLALLLSTAAQNQPPGLFMVSQDSN